MGVKRGERDRQRAVSQDSNMGSCTICQCVNTRPGVDKLSIEGPLSCKV